MSVHGWQQKVTAPFSLTVRESSPPAFTQLPEGRARRFEKSNDAAIDPLPAHVTSTRKPADQRAWWPRNAPDSTRWDQAWTTSLAAGSRASIEVAKISIEWVCSSTVFRLDTWKAGVCDGISASSPDGKELRWLSDLERVKAVQIDPMGHSRETGQNAGMARTERELSCDGQVRDPLRCNDGRAGCGGRAESLPSRRNIDRLVYTRA